MPADPMPEQHPRLFGFMRLLRSLLSEPER